MLLNQQHTYLEPLSSRKQQLGLDVVLLTLLARQGEKVRRVVHVGSLVASAAEPSAVLRDVFSFHPSDAWFWMRQCRCYKRLR